MLVHTMLKAASSFARAVRLAFLQAARFKASTSGSIILPFALAIVPLVIAASMAIDFTRATNEKAHLDTLLDSAALFGATKAAANSTAGNFNSEAVEAENFFTISVSNSARERTYLQSVSINLRRDPNDPTLIIATANYMASVDTTFVQAFKPSIAVSGTATASITVPSYIDFYLLLDHSPSMGLAATQLDIDNLVRLTNGCEFACHTINWDGSSDPNDNLAIARRNNVTLRIDLLRQATQALTQTALQTEQRSGLPNQFRMGVYGFNSGITVFSSGTPNGYTPDNGITADLTAAGNAALNMDLTPYRSDNNYFLTNFPNTFRNINQIVTNPGDGSTAARPRKFVFFVTDGVQDLTLNHPDGSHDFAYTQYDNTWGWGHAIAPIDPSVCTALKNRGVTIAVLYTPFLATSAGDSPLSDHDVALWQNDIPVKLTGCSSPGFYYQADSAGIAAAMRQMFTDALRSARLTN